jgi:hypothetical protein
MTTTTKRFDAAHRAVIDAGNRLKKDARSGEEVGATTCGLLGGAIAGWLQHKHPCGRQSCEDCAQINTPEKRLAELLRVVELYARNSSFFHAENDAKETVQ